jgi:hypothetical protein
MDVWSLLSLAVSSLATIALVHVAVFYVVKTLYPPLPKPVIALPPAPVPVVEQPLPPPVVPSAPPPAVPLNGPPPPIETKVPTQAPSPPAFSQSTKVEEKQDVTLPTYEAILASMSAA